MNRQFIFISLITIILSACNQTPTLAPKPRAFPKVLYPERSYQKVSPENCPMTFEIPTYTKIQRDSLFFDEEAPSDCWLNVYFPDFNCKIHCSYYAISEDKPLETLQQDAFELADYHMKKANFINELPIQKENQVRGFIFEIEGPAASPLQFYLTDETNHFLRGALYFNTQSRPDSLAPIIAFVKEDIGQLINSFEWQ